MSLPTIVAQTPSYFAESDHHPSERALRLAECFAGFTQALQDLGRKDAQKRREPLPDATFIDLTEQVIICGRDIADDCAKRYAQLMQESYMAGYNTYKEATAE